MREGTNKLSSAAIRLIQYTYGFDTPRDVMRKLANDLLLQSNQVSPPIEWGPIFKLRRIQVCYPSGNLDSANLLREAYIVPRQGGFELRFRSSGQSGGRVRFSIAHEIGHTYFFDTEANPPRKLSIWRGLESDEERLCDIFASELLMPEEMIRRFLPDHTQQSLSVVIQLSKKFKVTYEALSRRLIEDLAAWDAIVIGVSWSAKELPSGKGSSMKESNTNKWRLLWSSLPTRLRGTLYVPSARNHPSIGQVLAEEAFAKGCVTGRADQYKLGLGNFDKLISNSRGSERAVLEAVAIKPKALQFSHGGDPLDLETELRRRTEILVAVTFQSLNNEVT